LNKPVTLETVLDKLRFGKAVAFMVVYK
jgi:hypothetical protein